MGMQRMAYRVSPTCFFPDGGTHKDGKFVDLNAGGLRNQEMAQLVDKNQDAEQQNCQYDRHKRLHIT